MKSSPKDPNTELHHGWLNNPLEVQLLDPIGLDVQLALLHKLNSEGDTQKVINLMYRLLPTPNQLDEFTFNESLAAMRDLGIFIGILKRHGVEPVDAAPELEYVLLVLMVKTGFPPRDTLIHYTVWNPDGERIRTYTGLLDEQYLIQSVKVAYGPLLEAISLLDKLYELSPIEPSFAETAQATTSLLEGMVRGVVMARRNVSPAVFANELRYYFDPIKVDYGRQYIGPGAVEMPMFVVDHILWSCDCPDEAYTSFKEGFVEFNLPAVREIYRRYNDKPSLVTKMEAFLQANQSDVDLHVRAIKPVIDLITILKSFRMPHKKLAESAYKEKDETHRQQGSGGYSVDILEHIIMLQTQKTKNLIELSRLALVS